MKKYYHINVFWEVIDCENEFKLRKEELKSFGENTWLIGKNKKIKIGGDKCGG